MAITTGLTAALKKLVLVVEDDLRLRVDALPEVRQRWAAEHAEALAKGRTSAAWQPWRDDRVTQAAVAWVLTTVFVRFCEDNSLLKRVWFTGPGERRQEALDAELAFFRENPTLTDRDWLEQAIDHLRNVPATRGLVESHSPLWTVSPSGDVARQITDFWRQVDAHGELVWDFQDESLSTRFLGDLYQDLSQHAKDTYALLQTPVFVEEFILDQTLEPALAERPLEGFRLIDPTCGSGHFLLGAFDRFVARWAEHDPSLTPRQRTEKALGSVFGVDLNPFAVAIARFRLIVAALKAMEETSLETMPELALNLAVGDSLIHGRGALSEGFDELGGEDDRFGYSTEDLDELWRILARGSYDAVVGNPPYITVKDKQLNQRYRTLYSTCKGKYALAVPFMERFFDLARRGSDGRPAGWVGQITSNSFMKREFGSKLIEEFLPRQDLRLVVDTSGAYIPGHGTPTVIIVGRHASPASETVRAVLGNRGEPGQPADPARGVVWSVILRHAHEPGFEDEYITTSDLPRSVLSRHPWSLSGGAAPDVMEAISAGAEGCLSGRGVDIGMTDLTGEDDALTVPAERYRLKSPLAIPVVLGDEVRDFSVNPRSRALLPRRLDGDPLEPNTQEGRYLWPNRTVLKARLYFGQTPAERGLRWFDHAMFFANRHATRLAISFAFVATHNHFVLDRGGKVFKQSAPVIKLPAGATEDEHLELLGVLNSSTACFWLKQNSHNKGSTVDTKGARQTTVAWENFYEFTGTTLKDFPLPERLHLRRGQRLDGYAQRLATHAPAAVVTESVPTQAALDAASVSARAVREAMIAEQEELDWECYTLYGLLEDDLTYPGTTPPVRLGERAFEIALARAAGETGEGLEWFERHGSTPVTEIPERWPEDYRALVQRRLDLIESDRLIGLLERPEYKRRWAMEPWGKQVDKALRGWLLDRLEDPAYWFDAQGRPVARSVAQLADIAERDEDLVSVLRLWAHDAGATVTSLLARLLDGEAVPFLAAHRYKPSGLRKREAWEATWELQRREDAGEDVGTIPVPPKYTTADFTKQAYWSHRGKLDVPKERFILYPDASRSTDATELLGWAGWDHAQQALALAVVIHERLTNDGWSEARLEPLVAGLVELQPWVRQWHDEIDPAFGENLADFVDEQVRALTAQVGKTPDELRAWRPAPTRRGRRTTR